MLKSFTLFIFISLSPFFAKATLLDLSHDIDDAAYQAYVVFDDKDWAWVSPVNVQFDSCLSTIVNPENYLTTVLDNSGCANQLLAPQYREGWRFATDAELDIIFNVLTLNSFYDFGASMFIQATEYWNTDYINIDYLNFQANLISGEWGDNKDLETFYVRDHNSQSVPEPSILLIFALGLMPLASRKKIFS